MRPLRNGDLIPVDDAAELIDSAQDAAKKLARCCAAKEAESARLREAMTKEADAHDDACSALGATPCRCPFCGIAREESPEQIDTAHPRCSMCHRYCLPGKKHVCEDAPTSARERR